MDGDLIVLHCLPAFHDTKTQYGEMVAENLALLKWKLRMKSSAVNMVVNLKKQKQNAFY